MLTVDDVREKVRNGEYEVALPTPDGYADDDMWRAYHVAHTEARARFLDDVAEAIGLKDYTQTADMVIRVARDRGHGKMEVIWEAEQLAKIVNTALDEHGDLMVKRDQEAYDKAEADYQTKRVVDKFGNVFLSGV